MVAVGIHYKAFHFLVGANVDGAVEHGDIVVDLSQHNGDVFVQIFTFGLVCVGTSFFNQSVKIRIRDETAVASSTPAASNAQGSSRCSLRLRWKSSIRNTPYHVHLR